MSLDQKKAFHLVDRDFVFQVLEKMNFNKDVLAVIKALYQKKTSTSIQVNGHLSESVDLQRGERQGCPLSPSLYVVYAESFLAYILSQSGFVGIQLPHRVAKVSAYADDIFTFLSRPERCELYFSSFEYIKV